MSQFAQSGSAMDDAIGGDVDRGFGGVNQRLQLNQLQEGEVRESLNGRMEGHWKPRRGVVNRTSSLATGEVPLQLPFLLIDSAKTISSASYSANVVSVTITGHGFAVGTVGAGLVAGLTFTGTDSNGIVTLTYVDANTLSFPVSGVTAVSGSGTLSQIAINDDANANVRASCLFSDPNANDKEYVLIALDTVVKKIDLADYSVTDIAYPSGEALAAPTDMIQVFDKVLLFRDGQQAFEWFPNGRSITSASQTGTTVTVVVKDHGLKGGDTVVISGLTGGTPANGTFEVDSVIDVDTFTVEITSINITGTLVPDATGILPKAEGTINGAPYWQLPTGGTIVQWDSSNSWWTIIEPTNPGFASWVSDATTLGATPSPVDALNWVPGLAVVHPTATGTPTVAALTQTQTFGVTNGLMVTGFTLVSGGSYTQPQVFSSVGSDASSSDGLMTLDVSGNVTISEGDLIVVYETDIDEYSHLVGKEFYVTSATTTQIQFFAPVADHTATGSLYIEFGGRFSVGGGFTHQPGAPWGIHFQRRLWVPFYYNVAGTFNAPTYTSRKITDEIAVSDILDTNTFDQIENQFRISGGTADHVVAMHGFYDDGLVVLNRNSLHIIKGTLGSLLDTRVTELTSEVGCLARKSVVMRGNVMMFLSDDGVYGVEFLNDYNLRGADEPISKNIQPYIDRINKDYADKAVGILFENRYYLALPLDSAPGAGDSYGNNSILVFNFLNKAWESLDTFGDSRFLIDNFVIGSSGIRNNIYAVSASGGLHQLEASDSQLDRLIVDNTTGELVTPSINASLTTRGYDLGTMERKRFTDAQIVMQNLPNETGEYMISFASEDPDQAVEIGTTTDFLGGEVLDASPESETAGIRCRLAGIRGYTGTIILTRTIGSPKVNSIKIAGSITNRQILSQK